MQTRNRDIFTTIQTEGALLPSDLLQRIASGDARLDGLKPEDYHLRPGEKLNEAINHAWNRLQGAWSSFRTTSGRLERADAGTTVTRERWLLPLFQELGYGRLQTARAVEIDGKTYPVSHSWGAVPIHLVGFRVDLDKRSAGVAGAARTSPHSMAQELLNRSEEHLWAFVSNGLRLRILRDNTSLTRQAFVQFDLEAMMEGELYADFVLLWLLLHQSRVEGERPDRWWLERWSRTAQEQGTRALDTLRDGVQAAIEALGRGFLAHPANRALRQRLQSGDLATQDYYRQLLRLVYRLLFLFAAEDRELLLDPRADDEARARYLAYYSTRRLRELAQRRRGTRHADLFHGLRLVMRMLGEDGGCPALGLPSLGSFLFAGGEQGAIPDLEACEIANHDLLQAARELAFTVDGTALRPVDYRNMGAEELGSVYEALLELHPTMNVTAGTFSLATASGSERKTTGSYYTPSSLITVLLDSALDPVLDEAARQPNPGAAILDLKICDPACGSGHFLIAAAHRVAKRLATVETGDDEPAPDAVRSALRRVIGRCIYGVDLNPMAVELCKVSLWMETLVPGKPLTFLDHHIQVGNSLLGTTPALLRQGIPDAAFEPIEGDDRAYASAWKKRNKEERKRPQLSALDHNLQPWEALGDLAASMQRLDDIDDSTPEGVRRKQQQYEAMVRSQDYLYGTFRADAWCAAFVWSKTKEWDYPITESVFRQIERNPFDIAGWMKEEVVRLAHDYQFFHWHLRFPDVFHVPGKGEPPDDGQAGWRGGFDVVLGNPPWERIKLQEKEWFATRRPAIANAPNAAARKRMIDALQTEDPPLHAAWKDALREAEGESHLVRRSGRYPLTGRGDVNTYAIFAETNRLILGPTGRVGCIVPSGIATDSFNQYFFRELTNTKALHSLYDFENREKLFPAVDSRMKFCLLTLSGPDRPAEQGAEFVFFALNTGHLHEADRRFTLSEEDIALLNPNTRTCPIFRSLRDAELTKAIYRRVPVLVNETRGDDGNPWGFNGMLMFMMNTSSGLFRTREQLEAAGWTRAGNIFHHGEDTYLPLYEAKLIHHFDHRWVTYDGLDTRDLTSTEKADPDTVALPRYWVPATEVEARLAGRWEHGWLLGWRDIARSTDERTVIAGVFPDVAVGHTCPLMFPSPRLTSSIVGLQANLATFAFDYVARQKVGGTHLTFGLLNQLPVLAPDIYPRHIPWLSTNRLRMWLLPRVLELTYTAWDMQPFARDCGYDGPPFRWDEERRFLLRCELDAAYFHLYGIARDDVDYIMETFPIVKRKDEATWGEFRTKRAILDIYDAMQRAMETGEPYRTLLDPPPADPRVAHPPRDGGTEPPKRPVAREEAARYSVDARPQRAAENEARQPARATTMPAPSAARHPARERAHAPEPASRDAPEIGDVERRTHATDGASLPPRPAPDQRDAYALQPGLAGVEAAAASPSRAAVDAGDRVRHAAFGEGVVMRVEGRGDDALVSVQFRQAGLKKLMASMAKLERLA